MIENENLRLLRDLKIKSKYLMNRIDALEIELKEFGLPETDINDIFVYDRNKFCYPDCYEK